MSKRYLLSTIILLSFSSLYLFAQIDESEERMQKHVRFFTADSLEGRRAGTHGERMAANYFYDQLINFGVEMLTPRSGQDFSIKVDGDTLYSRNIVGIIEGYDPYLKNEYIVLGANLDHIGTNVLMIDGKKSRQIYRGADNNASGLAALIEIAQRVSASKFLFKRSVLIVAFGAKEMGLAGSWYFVNKAFPQVKDISLMIDINTIGKVSPYNYLKYYTCVPNVEITSIIGKASRNVSIPVPEIGVGKALSSDYLAFYEQNIPVTLITASNGVDHYSVKDTEDKIDYESMGIVCNFIYEYAKEVANLSEKVSKGIVTEISSASSQENVYSQYDVDKAPEFYHGNEKTFLERWVYDYLKYPEIPLRMGIQGQVIVEFVIEKDGSVSNVRITKGIDDQLDDEVVRVVSASPKWKPGVLNGKKVRVKYSVPVIFKLKKR